MSPRRKTPKNAHPEWVGGISSLPVYVTDEGEPYRPDVLMWMSDGLVLGNHTAKPGEILFGASESLRETMAAPMVGKAHKPQRVRVASPELAEALRAGHPDLDIVVAPTPEVDDAFAEMDERMDEHSGGEYTYLSPDLDATANASLFEAAAALFRATPWNVIPSDNSLLAITIPELGVSDAVVSVIGQAGESFGFILFSTLDDFVDFVDAADAMQHDEPAHVPPHFALNFERGAELPPELRKEIVRYGWEVAAPHAYPEVVAIDSDLVVRPPTTLEVAMTEAIARGLVEMLADPKALRSAWNGGDPVFHTCSVSTHQGPVEISLRAPFLPDELSDELSNAGRLIMKMHPSELLPALEDLALTDDEIDYELREMLEDQLFKIFVNAPEARSLAGELAYLPLVLDLAAGYLGHTVPTLRAAHLREVLFDWVPRKASIDASAAGLVVDELRAFYSFLKREFNLRQADACLKVLGKGTVQRLETALGDTGKFGMAKSLMAMGREEGFDIESPEGIAAWMASMQGKVLPESFPMPGMMPPPKRATKSTSSKKATKVRKAKRKKARKTRSKKR